MTGDLFKHTAVNVATENAPAFSTGFLVWLPDNLHIWDAFVDQAMKVIKRGYNHYSARTVIEFLRHHSALQEVHGEGWKINNNYTTDLARLFDLIYPQHAGLWEYRYTASSPRKPT